MRILLSLSTSLVFAATGTAQIVASDAFSYTGALTANGWTAHSGAGNKVIMSNGNHATLDQSTGSGEDVSLTFPAFGATDTIYASFRLRVPSGNTVNPVSGLYFAHFKDTTTLFRARTGVVAPASTGDFGLAINADNANLTVGTRWPVDLTFDTWYSVVISWNAGTNTSELWVNPSCGSTTSVSHTGTLTPGTLMSAFALRQASDYTGFIHVDDVQVGKAFADVLPGGGTFNVTCAGCAGLTQTASGSPNVGGTVYYDVPGATAVFLGATNMCLPLCAAGCNIGTDLTVVVFGTGFSLPVPCLSHLIGATVYTQGVSIGAGGCNASVFGVELATSQTIRTVIGS